MNKKTNKSQPLLSIVTVNRNNGAGLRRTMQSVFDLTFTDFEYIIIDGASTDNSVDVIKEFLAKPKYAKKITYWHSQPDKGVYDAMNKGIPHANGKFTLFLNSGDYLADKEVIKRLYNLDLNENEIIYTNAIFFDSKKEWTVTYPKKIWASFFFEKNPLCHQNILFPTSFLKDNPYSLEYKIAGDVDLYLKAYFERSINFRYINDTISKYENESGISSSDKTKSIRSQEWDKILKKYIPAQFWDDMEKLDTYEKKYHGILKALKGLLEAYSKRKNLFKLF